MPTSIRDQIVAKVVTTLGDVGKPAGLEVGRYRTRSRSALKQPAIDVYPVLEQTRRVGSPRSRLAEHRLTLRLECRATGEIPDAEQDPLLVWAIQALFADETLGGLANAIEESQKAWDAIGADATFGKVWLDVVVVYTANVANPTAAA